MEEEEYEVTSINAINIPPEYNQIFFKVKWGEDGGETWEPESNLDQCQIVLQDFFNNCPQAIEIYNNFKIKEATEKGLPIPKLAKKMSIKKLKAKLKKEQAKKQTMQTRSQRRFRNSSSSVSEESEYENFAENITDTHSIPILPASKTDNQDISKDLQIEVQTPEIEQTHPDLNIENDDTDKEESNTVEETVNEPIPQDNESESSESIEDLIRNSGKSYTFSTESSESDEIESLSVFESDDDIQTENGFKIECENCFPNTNEFYSTNLPDNPSSFNLPNQFCINTLKITHIYRILTSDSYAVSIKVADEEGELTVPFDVARYVCPHKLIDALLEEF